MAADNKNRESSLGKKCTKQLRLGGHRQFITRKTEELDRQKQPAPDLETPNYQSP